MGVEKKAPYYLNSGNKVPFGFVFGFKDVC